jgi:hypothetical protein
MSQLKKQLVTGRKVTRRSKAANTSMPSTQSGSTWTSGIKFFKQVAIWTWTPVRVSIKRWPKATLVVALIGTSAALAGYAIFRMMSALTSTLPERLEVISPRADLQSTISSIAADTLKAAQREHWSRSALTDKLLSRVSMVDGVDEVTIRSGLDRKLRINVVAQAPLLVLEGKGNERILVGSKFKIIARGLGSNDYGHLPQVEAPDLSLNIRPSRDNKRAQTGLFVRPSSSSSVNIRWLSQQAIKISSLFEIEKIPVDVERIVWRNGTGFSAIVQQRETSAQVVAEAIAPGTRQLPDAAQVQQQVGPHRFTIILGENQFSEKFSRLQQVIQDIRLNKSLVDQIDLAFSDKAIIKMNEQLSDAKHGGLQ